MKTLEELQGDLEKVLKDKKMHPDTGPQYSQKDIKSVHSILMDQSAHLKPDELQELVDTIVGVTPVLHFVVIMPESLKLVEFMIEKGVDLAAQEEKDHRTALHMVTAVTNNYELIDLLTKGDEDHYLVNIRDKDKRIPVHNVASKGGSKASTDGKIAKLLMERGSDPTAEDSKGRTPIARTLANKKINVDIMKEIAPYSDVNALNRDGHNLLLAMLIPTYSR